MTPVIQRSSGMLTRLSQPPTLLFSQMAATFLMHQLLRLILTSATRHMGTSRTLTRTSLIWWPPARDTPAALPPTASAPSMANRSAGFGPATYYCSYQCSRHHVTSSSSASMGLVLLRTTWRRGSVLQHSPSWVV